jgi:nucleoside-diphosphate-sugar epimerase
VVGPGQWRPFIHVRDLARAIVKVLEARPVVVQSQIYNVGDRRLNMTILQAGETVQRIAGRYREVQLTVRDNPADRRNYSVSFEKIRSQLGFEAATLMEPGVQEMVEEFVSGRCGDYRAAAYSNLATTRQALNGFHDPAEMARLYAPLQPDLKPSAASAK